MGILKNIKTFLVLLGFKRINFSKQYLDDFNITIVTWESHVKRCQYSYITSVAKFSALKLKFAEDEYDIVKSGSIKFLL